MSRDLFFYADCGNTANVELFIKSAQAKLEYKLDCGRTPIIAAAENGHAQTVKVLLDNGAKRMRRQWTDGRLS